MLFIIRHVGGLGVTFFSVCPSVRIYVRKFWEIQFGMPGMARDGPRPPPDPPVPVQWTGRRPEVDWKWTGSGPEVDLYVLLSVCLHFPYLLMRGIYKRRALAPCDFFMFISSFKLVNKRVCDFFQTYFCDL